MSNDLISRKELLEKLKEKVYPEKFGERCNPLDVIYAVLQIIEELPTAYDVDGGVERLEEIREEILTDTAYDNDTVNHYLGYVDLMIEGAKAGGVNG